MKHISLIFVVMLLISSLTLTANSPPQLDNQSNQISAVMIDQNFEPLFSQGVMVVPTMLWFKQGSQPSLLPTIMATARSGTINNYDLMLSDHYISTFKTGSGNIFQVKETEVGTSSPQIVSLATKALKV